MEEEEKLKTCYYSNYGDETRPRVHDDPWVRYPYTLGKASKHTLSPMISRTVQVQWLCFHFSVTAEVRHVTLAQVQGRLGDNVYQYTKLSLTLVQNRHEYELRAQEDEQTCVRCRSLTTWGISTV